MSFLDFGLRLAGMSDETINNFNDDLPEMAELIRLARKAEPLMREAMPLLEEAQPIIAKMVPLFMQLLPILKKSQPVIEGAVPLVNEAIPLIKEIMPTAVELIKFIDEKSKKYKTTTHTAGGGSFDDPSRQGSG